MMIPRTCRLTALLLSAISAHSHAGHEVKPEFKSNLTKEVVPEETKIDLFEVQSDYVFQSKLHGSRGKGEQDVAYQSGEYGHRFLISGKWYFRAGLAYERYDFGGTKAPTPGKLQSFRVPLALEYVQDDYVGATVKIEPGFFYENDVRANAFDLPWEAYFTLKLRDDHLYGVLGASGAQYYSVPVVPVIGLIWIVDDAKKFRVEAVFPRPAVVYNMSDDWEFRLQGEIKGGGYRTDKQSAFTPAKLNNAVVEYYEYRVGAQVTFSKWKPFDLVLNAGYALERTFDYYRADKVFKADPAPYVRLELDAEF
jgi:hypothetical protein